MTTYLTMFEKDPERVTSMLLYQRNVVQREEGAYSENYCSRTWKTFS